MTAREAMDFVRKHGVVLAAGKGPVPRLTEAIVDEPIKGSWWAHPKSHHIFAVLQAVARSEDVLVCRLVGGKITLVHRRLWPALARVAKRFPVDRVKQVREVHTAAGHHLTREVPFPEWVPPEVLEKAGSIGEEEAVSALGPWALLSQSSRPRRKRGAS